VKINLTHVGETGPESFTKKIKFIQSLKKKKIVTTASKK
jgi:hypothetical protein